jgi:NADH-quinone oxidoreductase subunit N
LAGYASVKLWGNVGYGFRDMVIVDNLAIMFNLIFITVSILSILMSIDYIKRFSMNYGEYYCLILFATSGMILMAGTTDLVTIFLGLEILSLALYVLAGLNRKDVLSNEAALKYFLLGAFATGFVLYGIALFYGGTGTTNLTLANKFISTAGGGNTILWIGMGLLLIGFGFKVSAVPFHMWTPDVYEGAPTPVTAFMSAGSKAAGFSVLLRIFGQAYSMPGWEEAVIIIAVLTMTVGNLVALAQNNIKRMLAYSSIAHAGYLLIALLVRNQSGMASLLFYLIVYVFMNLGAFAVVMCLDKRGEESLLISDYAGLGFRYPFIGLSMALFMCSLAGIPPTAGFAGKFFIFKAGINAGYAGLVLVGVLNSVLSVFYYLRLLVIMYMHEPTRDTPSIYFSPLLAITIIICFCVTIYVGIFPSIKMGTVLFLP